MIDTSIKVGSLELKNRLVMPPMLTNRSDRGRVTPEMAEYYLDRARYSAPGLIITEHSCIAESGRASENQLSIADDGTIEGHRQLTQAIHAGGSRAFVQLNHAGSNGLSERVSASDISVPAAGSAPGPRPLTVSEIKALQGLFAAAAERGMRAGYDGVEIHCAHSYLLNQFYSPMTNRREDEYGGSLENRLRFLLETVAAVRAAVGVDTPVAVRLGGADYMPGGSTEEDAARAAVLLEEAGVDLIDLSGGMCFYTRPGHSEAGYFSSMSEKVKKAVSAVPVLLTGGVRRLADAERLLSEGKADLIGVGRPLFMDAHWREKA